MSRFYFTFLKESAPQELGSLKRSNNYIVLPKAQRSAARGAALNLCYGCRADVTGNWSGQARRGEGEGLQRYPCPGPGVVLRPYMDSGLGRHRGSQKIAFWIKSLLLQPKGKPLERLVSIGIWPIVNLA